VTTARTQREVRPVAAERHVRHHLSADAAERAGRAAREWIARCIRADPEPATRDIRPIRAAQVEHGTHAELRNGGLGQRRVRDSGSRREPRVRPREDRPELERPLDRPAAAQAPACIALDVLLFLRVLIVFVFAGSRIGIVAGARTEVPEQRWRDP
jgi:hypothetical protein